jgi:hypothetical protein
LPVAAGGRQQAAAAVGMSAASREQGGRLAQAKKQARKKNADLPLGQSQLPYGFTLHSFDVDE